MFSVCSNRPAVPGGLIALALLLVGCGSSGNFYRDVDDCVSSGDYTSAIECVKQNRDWYGERSSVLYNLDLGLLYHYAVEPDSSMQYFFSAEREIDDLYTKSISQNILSFVLNDNILPYDGEDFEKVLINVFLALDYAQEGMMDDALVEARKVDLKLREYARKYDEKNTYKDDAFIRYIAGVLYEADGETNDAFISYRKAYETYQNYSTTYGTHPPSFLLDDLVRTASKLSFTEEVSYYDSLGGRSYDPVSDSLGTAIVIIYSGKGPIKHEERPTVSIPDSSGTLHTFQIALPKFVPRCLSTRTYAITATSSSDSLDATAELAEDITAIAGKALDDRLTLVYLKSGGRALLKLLAAEKMKSEMKKDGNDGARNFLGSLAIDLAVGATERADLRGWRTLPAQIHLARLQLKPGLYNVRVASEDDFHSLDQYDVRIISGKTTFVIVDDVR